MFFDCRRTFPLLFLSLSFSFNCNMTTVLSKNAIVPAALVAGTAVGCYIVSFLLRVCTWKDLANLKDENIKISKKVFQKDVVYVYGFGKMKGVMASPFVHKLHAFLKYSGIPHEIVKGDHMGKTPRRKLPFIELNGQVITDSSKIISFLSSYFNKNIDEDLTKEEKAISHSLIRLLEEHYYWTMIYYRWKNAEGWKGFAKALPVPAFIRATVGPVIRERVVNQLMGQGTARLDDQEVLTRAREDLESCSSLLNNNSFFFGKSKPHLVDIVLYSALACQDLAIPTPHYLLLSSFPSLLEHKKRMEGLIPINTVSA